MLKRETIENIAKTIGLNAEELAKAISDEKEQDLSIPKLTTYTNDEWEQFQNKIDEEKKERYESGKTAGIEMKIKEEKEKYDLKFEGKSFDDFVKNLKNKVLEEAKIEPEQKTKELESDLSKVREQVKIYEETLKTKEEEYSINLKNYKIQNELEKIIPENLTNIDREDAKIITRANFEFDFEGENFIVKKGGEVIKDKTRQPIHPKEVLTEFFKERKYIVEEGRGGGDSKIFGGGGKITKMSEFQEYCDKNNININGEQARVKLSEITKENKEFDFNS